MVLYDSVYLGISIWNTYLQFPLKTLISESLTQFTPWILDRKLISQYNELWL